jgi:general secretion pathway protein G
MLEELLDNEKRAYSFLAMIPVFGPLFISASERHTEEEKRRLSVLSIGLTVAIIALLWTLVPTPADQTGRLHQRIESEMRVLRNIAEQYRTQSGAYPTPVTWKRLADRADARFFDPWGRPYRYDLREDGVQLQTLGQDGLEGGSGKDADVTVDQRPPL